MKHFLISLLILSSLTSQAQNKRSSEKDGSGAAIAVTAVAGAVAVAAEIHRIQEILELFGTEHILGNYPEIKEFSLKLNSTAGLKPSDLSGVGLLTFNVSLGATIETDQERFVLAAFFTPGFITSYGIDYQKVNFVKWDTDTWNAIIANYIELASGLDIVDKSRIPIYKREFNKENAEISVLNKKGKIAYYSKSDKYVPINKVMLKTRGVFYRGKNSDGSSEVLVAVPYRKLKGDSYVVSDFSNEYVFVYNEKSLGIYIKQTGSLVQISTLLLFDIHKFVNNYGDQ